MAVFSLPMKEIIFLLFAVLMLFGTDKLPGFIRMAGKIIRSVRNASNDLKSEISKVSMENSVVKDIEEGVKEIKDTIEDTVSRTK